MAKRFFILTITVLAMISCHAFADIIYLNNGDVIQGDIIDKSYNSLTVKEKGVIINIRTEDIKDIKTYNDIKNENDVHGEAMYDLNQKLGENSLEFAFGPQFGIYNFQETSVSQYHKNGLMLGVKANLWIKKTNGVQLEFESYNNTFNGSILATDPSTGLTAWNSYSEKISLMPFWLSYLHKFKEQPFYVGAGVGFVMAELDTTTGLTENHLQDNFPGYQLMAGYVYKKIGLEFKYINIQTNVYWGNYNYGGYSLLFDIYF